MNIARSFLIIAAIATLVAVALGMGTYSHTDFTSIHMVSGLIVALALLILAVIAVFSKGLRGLGAIGIVYAFIVPIFGVTQQKILVGDLHWLIETAHMVVGAGALALIGTISGRLTRRRTAAVATSSYSEAVKQ